jgi:hypothetical protein
MVERDKTDLMQIPASEFGPGCHLDLQNNRLIGASGQVYENVQVNVADMMREFPPKTTH